jgi:uncharacterized protein (TIGR03437 family)
MLVAQNAPSPMLSYSTYLRGGFTPLAMAADTAGNVYLAGSVMPDPFTSNDSVLAIKLNPQATGYVYVSLLNGLASASPTAIAVDASGNLWITGHNFISSDPAHADTAPGVQQSFLTKLDPSGAVLFSKIYGSPAQSYGQAIRVTAKGDVLVSGLVLTTGFPTTPGAYSVPDSAARPYLVKFDAAGNQLFSATGIGGTSIALDAAGNIFVAGNTGQTDYPTTPGAYQTKFVGTFSCVSMSPIGFCFIATNQYVTKLDPNASTLLYSTGINGMDTEPTSNTGLAVDAAGFAYVTGATQSLKYPFTVMPGQSPVAIPFVTKLDPAGKSLVWSVPQGGTGLQYDAASNSLYVTGMLSTPWTIGFVPSGTPPPPPTGMASLPVPCLTNNLTSITEGYAAQVDAATGQTTAALLINGSRVSLTGTALAGTGLFWFTGQTSQADVPFTPGALAPRGLVPGPSEGAYLGAIDFSQTSTTAPVLSCVLDAADGAPVGLAAPNQLLALYGSNLGPAVGVQAPDGGAQSVGGVSVAFDGKPGQVLYVSASQINLAVPFGVSSETSTVMQVTVNGTTSAPRMLLVTPSNPALFGTPSFAITPCSGIPVVSSSVAITAPIALNADGKQNSCLTPAKPGSVVSFFVNGVGEGAPYPSGDNMPFPRGLEFDAVAGSWSAEVVNVAKDSDFVWRVDVRLPAGFAPPSPQTINVTIREGPLLVGPLQLFYVGSQAAQMPILGAIVWVAG